MKVFIKIFLLLVFIPVFLLSVLTATTKFQILNSNFWLSTFEENYIYKPLALKLKKETELKVEKEGGKKGDVGIITSLITEENIKIVVEKNVVNILDFSNGKLENLKIYLPISQTPKGLLPPSVATIPDEITLENFLQEFNIQGISSLQVSVIPESLQWVVPILFVEVLILVMIVFILFKLENSTKRMVFPALAFLLSGLVLTAISVGGYIVKSTIFSEWAVSLEPSQQILSIFLPFILGKIINMWFWIGMLSILFGGILLFLKKREINSINK